MENNNMTAVEWLVSSLDCVDIGSGMKMHIHIPKCFIEQAKIREEQNIRMAWTDGHSLGQNGLVVVDYSNSKEYYDKYYKR